MNTADTITENPSQAQTIEQREYLIGLALQPFFFGPASISIQVLLMDLVHQTLLAAGIRNRLDGAMTSPPAIVILVRSTDRRAVLNTLAEFIQSRWGVAGLWEMAWHDPAECVWRNVVSPANLPFERHLTEERLRVAFDLVSARQEAMNAFRDGLGLPPVKLPGLDATDSES